MTTAWNSRWAEQIEAIRREFEDGRRFVELASPEPQRDRERLHKAVRGRDIWNWRFSSTDRSVFVRQA